MAVRAKFVLQEKTEIKVQSDEMGYKLKFTAVTGGSEENDSFFKWTPNATIELMTVNAKAAEEFITGEQYYVDFTKVQ